MPNKRSSKAAAKRRQARLEVKRQLRAEHRQAQRRRAFIAIGAVLAVLGLGVVIWYGSTTWWKSADAAAPVAPGSTDPVSPADEILFASGWAASPAPPSADSVTNGEWTATIDTNQGPIVVELFGDVAPQATASFTALGNEGFFNNTDCHRLTTQGIFVLQCGDPQGTGTGGPSYRFGPIENAPEDNIYPAGTLAMARVGNDANSMGSQFFIVYEDSFIPSDSAGGYTVFGKVTSGLDIVETVASGGTISGSTDGRPAMSVIITEVNAS